MPLPLITDNMFFDTVLRAIETTLKAESQNQIDLGGIGWSTVRERFDPWNVTVDKFHPGVVNIVWSSSNFSEGEGNNFDQTSLSNFDIDCYASKKALLAGGKVTPADQRTADVAHALVSKIYYTIMSPVYYDLGLTPGTIVKPWITNILKFVPIEKNVPLEDVVAVRFSCKIVFKEVTAQIEGENLNIINVTSDTEAGGQIEQKFDLTS